MLKLQNIFYLLAGITIFLLLIWNVAVPDDLIREGLEDAVRRSGNGSLRLSIEGLKKGIFLTLHADSLNLQIDNEPALHVTDFSGRCSLRYLTGGELAFAIKGRIGTGDVYGILKLPLNADIKIAGAELNAIPYLRQFNIDIMGRVFSDITMDGHTARVVFKVPDLNIDDSGSVIPLLNTFSSLQGAMSLRADTIKIDSISLNGDKGYARLQGNITSNVMDLTLELMPYAGKLSDMESMLIGKYIVSPGYYVIPIKGPLP